MYENVIHISKLFTVIKQGRIQTMWKMSFHKAKLSNLHKIGGKSRKKSELSHQSVLTLHPPWLRVYW